MPQALTFLRLDLPFGPYRKYPPAAAAISPAPTARPAANLVSFCMPFFCIFAAIIYFNYLLLNFLRGFFNCPGRTLSFLFISRPGGPVPNQAKCPLNRQGTD